MYLLVKAHTDGQWDSIEIVMLMQLEPTQLSTLQEAARKLHDALDTTSVTCWDEPEASWELDDLPDDVIDLFEPADVYSVHISDADAQVLLERKTTYTVSACRLQVWWNGDISWEGGEKHTNVPVSSHVLESQMLDALAGSQPEALRLG